MTPASRCVFAQMVHHVVCIVTNNVLLSNILTRTGLNSGATLATANTSSGPNGALLFAVIDRC